MAIYAIYTYEVQEGNRSLFYKQTGKKAIDMSNEIIGNLLHDGLFIVGKKKKQDLPLKSLHLTELFRLLYAGKSAVTQVGSNTGR